MTNLEFIDTGDGDYAIVCSEGVIEASRIRWQGDDLIGEVTITPDGGVPVGPLALSFIKPKSRSDVLAATQDAKLAAALNDLCRQISECERQNTSPVVNLREVPKPSPEREYEVPLLPSLPRHNMAIWFGDGGNGKSVLALYTAGHLATQDLQVLYLDWELDQAEHRLRYEQLFGAAMPNGLFYWRCDRPLPQISDAIRRTIKKHRIDYVIVDSIAFACGGGAESSDAATQYANHVRSFGVGSLHLAHTTKGDQAKSKPFGSTFWHNSARSTWYIEGSNPANRNGVFETDLYLHHRKSNFGPLENHPRQLRFTAEENRGAIRLTTRMVTTGKAPTVSERLREVLKKSPLSRDELKLRLSDVDPKTLNTTLSRGKGKWLNEKNGVIALVAGVSASAA